MAERAPWDAEVAPWEGGGAAVAEAEPEAPKASGIADQLWTQPNPMLGGFSLAQMGDIVERQKALPVLLGNFAGYVERLADTTNQLRTPDKDGVTPIEREVQRRKDAGEPTDVRAIEEWVSKEAKRKIFNKPDEPELGMVEYGKKIVQEVVDNPKKAIQGFMEYAATHPEVILAGPVNGLLIAAGENILEQATERQQIDYSKLAVDTLMDAVPIAAVHAPIRVMNWRKAKADGKEPTVEFEEKALQDVNAKVEAGTPLETAFHDMQRVMEVPPEDRVVFDEALAKGVEDAQAVRKDEGQVQGVGDEQRIREDQGGEDLQRATQAGEPPRVEDGGARPVDDASRITGELPPDVRPPKVSEELRKLENRERRIITEVEGLKGEAKYDALKQIAREKEALSAQSGRIDPKLLAGLGVVGLGAVGGYWLNKDPYEAVRGALITGGIGAAVLAGRGVWNASNKILDGIKDTRYNPKHLTEQYLGSIKVGELAIARQAWGIEGLVNNKKARENITHAIQEGDLSKLSPVERQAAEFAKRFFEETGERARAAGIGIDDLIENYVTQLWVKGANSKESLWSNLKGIVKESGPSGPGMSPKTRFGMHRMIPNYKAGIEAGYVPVTLDIAEIMRIYGNNINRAIQNQKLINGLKRDTLPDGTPSLAKGADLDQEIDFRRQQARNPQLDPAANQMVAEIQRIKAPKEYVAINHPQLMGYRVHPDIAPPLKALFDAGDPLAITKAAHAVSIAAKRGIFSFSLFHAKSLLDAAMGAGTRTARMVPGSMGVLKGTGDPRLMGYLNDLVRGGLNVVEKPLEADANAFRNALRMIEEKTPLPINAPVRGVRWVQEHMDKFLWGLVHPSLKVATALANYEKALIDPKFFGKVTRRAGQMARIAPDWRNVPKERIAGDVAQFTNDIFGGIDWFRIADATQTKYLRDLALGFASPSGRRLMQIALLAPDWTVATARSMYKAFPGMSSPQVAALHRQYLLRQAIVYLTLYNGINNYFSRHHIWENEDPTMVDLGDGRKMQMSKHTMEPVHWLTQPSQQAFNKLGYPIREPILQALNKDFVSLKSGSPTGPPITESLDNIGEEALKRGAHLVKGMLPIPLTTTASQGPGTALSGMLGVPIYGRTEEKAISDAVERALRVRQQKIERGTPEDKAKAKSKTEAQTAASAKRRVQNQYQKRREKQRERER